MVFESTDIEINTERLTQEFIKVAQIPSPSFRERGVTDYLAGRLAELGLQVEEDQTGERIGGDSGNLLGRLPGDDRLTPLFLCCHMDTVQPGDGVKVIFQDGVFRSAGETVLGGDDKAGVVSVIEVLEMLKESQVPHAPLEILFTVAEEQGLYGSKYFDHSKLKAAYGYILDSSGSPGTIIVAAPAQNIIDFTVIGKAAHAGMEPEQGINAIRVAAEALVKLKMGRIDQETTANIGVIKGGNATNIVPDSVYLQGEVRSLDRKKLDDLTSEIVTEFTRVVEAAGAQGDVRVTFQYPEFRLDPELPVVKYATQAAARSGLEVRLVTSGGGSDANNFNNAGIPTVNLGTGMSQVHTTEEYLKLHDLEAGTRWLWEILKLAGGTKRS